ncbi:kinase-like domain-containing protein [Chaetomium sp. MPI-CAGE-AT-0009]|nr:kinase-like domain-containing protein [Chaetomium sp. MPI-CAGE-AT-0009]
MSRPSLSEFLPDDEPWPPVLPNVEFSALDVEKPELAVTGRSMIYRIKGQPSKVFKFHGTYREYQLHKAAGDCAIPVCGKVISKMTSPNGSFAFYGFIMDLATPISAPGSVPPSQRRSIMHQMIRIVERLHAKGIIHGDVKLENILLDNQGLVRLGDFGEGRYVDEDEQIWIWEGATTQHIESPNRLQRAEQSGHDPSPPIVEDDMYGLGLAIWQLYTGEMPHAEYAMDDMELKERQRKGETVDVAAVQDPEAREIITNLLRMGGARI